MPSNLTQPKLVRTRKAQKQKKNKNYVIMRKQKEVKKSSEEHKNGGVELRV
jgi:hypothetical protein